jgi:hypothetical protein
VATFFPLYLVQVTCPVSYPPVPFHHVIFILATLFCICVLVQLFLYATFPQLVSKRAPMLRLFLVTTYGCDRRVEKHIGLKKIYSSVICFLKNLNPYVLYCTNGHFLFIPGFSVLIGIPGHRGEYWKLVPVTQYVQNMIIFTSVFWAF